MFPDIIVIEHQNDSTSVNACKKSFFFLHCIVPRLIALYFSCTFRWVNVVWTVERASLLFEFVKVNFIGYGSMESCPFERVYRLGILRSRVRVRLEGVELLVE